MKQIPDYHQKPECYESQSRIAAQGKDDAGNYVILENTIFYPQGGGQPSDQGMMRVENLEIPIHSVKIKEGEIRHYTAVEIPDFNNAAVSMTIDSQRRTLNSRLHSAGHVISHAIEDIYPGCRAIKGHHFPGECYVEFQYSEEVDLSLVNAKIEQLIQQNAHVASAYVSGAELPKLCPNLSYTVPAHDQIRLIKIGAYEQQPCCGTHVQSLGELRGLRITKQKSKGGTLKLTYEINC